MEREIFVSTSARGVRRRAVVFTELKSSQLNLYLADGQLTPPIDRHVKLRTPKLDPASLTPHLIHDKSVIHGFVLDTPWNETCFSIADERGDSRTERNTADQVRNTTDTRLGNFSFVCFRGDRSIAFDL